MARKGNLSPKQEVAITALIAQPSITDAAKSTKIGERTLWRWLRMDNFKQAYLVARRQVVSQAIGKVQAGMTAATETLLEVMKDQNSSPSARVSAARTILDFGLKSIEIEELELRVEALEKAIKENKL
jgi:hypothetical protein